MRFPLLLFSYAAGIVCANHFAPFPHYSYALPAGMALLWLGLRQYQHTAFTLLLLLCFCSGGLLYSLARFPSLSADHIVNFVSEEEIMVDGRIFAITNRAPEGYTLDIDTFRLRSICAERTIHGRLRLYVESGTAFLAPGDDIRFRSALRTPRPFDKEGFDLARQLAGKAIFVTAFTLNAEDILLLSATPATFANSIDRGRAQTARFIDHSITGPLAPLVRALAIGDKGGLAPELAELLACGGVSHLFAISGLHLGLVAAALYALVLTGYRRSERLLLYSPPARVLPLVIAPVLVFYLFWTGSAFSTQRALLMVLALSGLLLLRRRTDSINLLWFAAFTILLVEPLALFEPSFQLSFAAVAGILLGYRRWRPLLEPLPKTARWIATLFLSSGAATLATLPLVLFHFHLLAPAGLLINLIAIPLIGWLAVPTALAGSLIWPICSYGGDLLFHGCETVVSWMLALVRFTLSAPLLSGWTIYTTSEILVALSLLIITLFLAPSARTARLLLVGGAALALILSPLPPDGLRVTVFSVGQGESMLLSVAGQQILIDGGGLYGERFDPGRQLVAPALGRLGIRTLDAVILTHEHPDHAKGLNAILKDFPCRALWLGEPLEPETELAVTVFANEIPISYLPTGWTHQLPAGEVDFDLYRPASREKGNNQSLVVYARAGNQGVLLPGDLEAAGVRQLLALRPNGPVTLLKLPHHGSRHSSPELLIDALHPAQVFVSVGADNRFNFPDQVVLENLLQRKIPLFRTDQDGSFRFSATSMGWRFEPL